MKYFLQSIVFIGLCATLTTSGTFFVDYLEDILNQIDTLNQTINNQVDFSANEAFTRFAALENKFHNPPIQQLPDEEVARHHAAYMRYSHDISALQNLTAAGMFSSSIAYLARKISTLQKHVEDLIGELLNEQ